MKEVYKPFYGDLAQDLHTFIRHEHVAEVHVFDVSHPHRGETVHAQVVLHNNICVSADDLICNSRELVSLQGSAANIFWSSDRKNVKQEGFPAKQLNQRRFL